ncbi:MAG: UbiA family prenyltransferase [Planctomycetota bacterium]
MSGVPADAAEIAEPRAANIGDFVRLARPKQWAKSAFVLVGPLYWLQDSQPEHLTEAMPHLITVGIAAAVFALASSGCYVVNDLGDAEADRAHPRKRNRPIASGVIRPNQAKVFAMALYAVAALGLIFIPSPARWVVGGLVGAYVANVLLYSSVLKRVMIADVMSLSMGFVLRVFAGCAAIAIAPTTWLLNVTLFLSMLLAFGKRLGERRSAGDEQAAEKIRSVQKAYSDDLLRMLMVVSGVATMLTYAGYVTTRAEAYSAWGLNLLWLTTLPAIFGLLRAIALLERGRFDDPTELAFGDRPFQVSALLFVAMTLALVGANTAGWMPGSI